MSTARSMGVDAASRFRENTFRRLPLACMAAMAAAAVTGGLGFLLPLPWIISLAFVGLPHGAADFAASRRAWRGWPLVAAWAAYAAAMALTAACFAAAPQLAIVAFAALSCWHFGAAHLDADASEVVVRPRTVAVLARGCAVLAMPFAAWPEATARAAVDLATLAVGTAAATTTFPPHAVRTAGLALAAVATVATAVEGLLVAGQPGGLRACRRLLVELSVIVGVGWLADPLFAVGLYFLAWHAWRQMEPLAEAVTDPAPKSWRELGAALVRVHAAALPLLIPTWVAIAVAWWRLSATHSLRDLAIVSIAAYLVVTPAHEILGDLLRSLADRRALGPVPRDRQGRHGGPLPDAVRRAAAVR